MKRFETISLRFAKEKPISSGVNSGSGDPPARIIPEIIMNPSPEWRAVAASCWGSPQWAPARWDMWDSWDRLGRGRVQICCKGAPGRDRPREEARNINDSPPAPQLNPGLCNRFGQTAPLWRPRGGLRRTNSPHDDRGASPDTALSPRPDPHRTGRFAPAFGQGGAPAESMTR